MIHINRACPAWRQGDAAMWTYYPELLATPVPRYTSYPTAAEFHDGIGETDHRAALAAIGQDEEISLYVHIPYCREICWYCGCNTGAANRTHRLAGYLDLLADEITLVGEAVRGRRVTRVAFGGGSPNAISASQFLALVDRLKAAFRLTSDTILSAEIDPRAFDAEFAEALGRAGVERASLGVQTFDSVIQAAIGRIQPTSLIEQSVRLLRDAGVKSLNFDLMYGLPRQSCEALADSLEQSSALGADRLAVFGYAHVPHLIPRQRRIDASSLPGPVARFEQAGSAYEWLVGRGWASVGFDHFARPYDPLAEAARRRLIRRNFQGFTDDPCDTIVGLGASAISRLPGLLVQNERNSGRYGMKVGLGRTASMRGVAVPADERRRAGLIESLLCHGSADIEAAPDLAGLQARLQCCEDKRLIRWDGSRLVVTAAGLPYRRTVAATLDPWRSATAFRFSSAV